MQKSYYDYPVEFAEDMFGASPVLANVLKKIAVDGEPKVLIVADMNVVQRTEGLGSKVGRYVQEHGIALAGTPVVITGGEKTKADNLQSALTVVSAILSAKLGKNDVVLALGGGTVMDVAGYAAAQVRGGVRLVRVPTTPAAMMDAAFADYAAVDSVTVKDALRVPSTPAAVVIDCGFAVSVLDGVWRGGIAEAVRQAAALDGTLMKKLVKLAPAYGARDMKVLEEIVRQTVASRLKKGPTALALWSAFRLEAMSGYKLPHGYAVAMGLCVDLGYSVEKGLLKPESFETVVGVLRTCGALDGMTHSRHLLSQADSLLLGLDAWALSSGSRTIAAVTGAWKSTTDEIPDREAFGRALKNVSTCSTETGNLVK